MRMAGRMMCAEFLLSTYAIHQYIQRIDRQRRCIRIGIRAVQTIPYLIHHSCK